MFNLFPNKNNTRSFEENLLAHVDSFYNLAYRLTRNRQQAEDLVQEASLRGFKKYYQFKPGTNFRAWMFTIVRNIYINEYRRRKREPLTVNFEEVENFVSLGEFSGLEEELFGETVQLSIDQLPEELRTTLMLFYGDDLTYKEIAGVMKCPIGTVMSRLFVARQSLKKRMNQTIKNNLTNSRRNEQKFKEEG